MILNVYATCDVLVKKKLWIDILAAKRRVPEDMWCCVRDFNLVRVKEDIKGGVVVGNRGVVKEDMRLFNVFVQMLGLVNLLLLGQKKF